jgi:uncharacterized membrane protein YeiH
MPMNWELLSLIGIIAFAISGAIVAMEEEYDILGVYILGFCTAFAGGIIRNVLIGKPVTMLWDQSFYFLIALLAMTLLFLVPLKWIVIWKSVEVFFDAIGLAAFSIQGAFYAVSMGHSLMAVIVAAMLTGIGGGMVRDVLAGRKPLVLRDEVYAVWAILAGFCIGLGWIQNVWYTIALFMIVVIMRMFSYFFKWKLPKRSLKEMQRSE